MSFNFNFFVKRLEFGIVCIYRLAKLFGAASNKLRSKQMIWNCLLAAELLLTVLATTATATVYLFTNTLTFCDTHMVCMCRRSLLMGIIAPTPQLVPVF
jgi:hypothetical protein